MKHHYAIGILFAALTCAGSAQLSAQDVPAQDAVRSDWPQFLSSDGETVIDSVNNVVWLADANLAAKILSDKMPPDNNFRFGLPVCPPLTIEPTEPCVNPSGSMNYTSAVKWVQRMNDANYLGIPTGNCPQRRSMILTARQRGRGLIAKVSRSAAIRARWDTSTTRLWASRRPIPRFPSHPTRWGHSAISNLITIGPIRPVAATLAPVPLPISVSPAENTAAVAEVITRMFCR